MMYLFFQVLEIIYFIDKLGIRKVLPMHRPFMVVKMRFSFKSFETNVTNIWAFTGMNPFVHFQIRFPLENLVAYVTNVASFRTGV